MPQSVFARLKQEVVFSVSKYDNHSTLLNVLKEMYRDDIDSERKFEQIITISQLLKMLEKRDVLSADNIGPLKEIISKLNNNELYVKLNEYEKNHVPIENVNYYGAKNPTDSSKNETVQTNNLFTNISSKKEKRIKEALVDEIGSHWRDLARNLKIREGKIDKIDMSNRTLEEKAREIFKNYIEDIADPNKWFFVLCDALEKSRRKDLSRYLQEIMMTNI